MNFRILVLAALSVCAGSSWSQTTRLVPGQYPTIQAAINASVNGDSIVVAAGSYSGTVNFNGKTLTMTGAGSGTTTLFGVGGAAVVTFQGGEGPATTLQGFRITGGGPGIYCHNASPQISNCVINYNFAPAGTAAAAGGIRVTIDAGTGSPTISNCTISNNSGFRGGAVSFEASGTGNSSPTVVGCTVSGNTALVDNGNSGSGNGGGFYIAGAVQAAIVTTAITDNDTIGQGGGINGQGVSHLIDRCRITGNQSNSGAALACGSACTIVGTLIASNVMLPSPCGIQCYSAPVELSGSPVIQSCTIAGNVNAFGLPGGISTFGGNITITSSIVWGNTGLDIFRNPATNITPSYCDIGTTNFAFTSPNFSADPLFVDADGGDFHLASSSPCRNAGSPNPAGLPPTDLDGLARIAGPAVDVGVDEIPVLAYPGTTDGLDVYARINGVGDPLASTRSAAAGNLLTVLTKSSNTALIGGNPLFAVQVFPTGAPPTPLGPSIWIDGTALIIFGTLSPPPFGVPGLSPAGLTFNFTAPAGLAGMTVRMQAFVTSINALNGQFATSNATEITF